VPEFGKIFGKNNIYIFNILLREEESVKRNSGRRMCRANRHSIPNFTENRKLMTCPQDGSELITRDDDKPEVIHERYKVYLRDTAPVLDYFKKNNYPVAEINGEQPVEAVYNDISKYLKS
jgi:adenylate kinase